MTITRLFSLPFSAVRRAFHAYHLRHKISRIDRHLREIEVARRHDFLVERHLTRERIWLDIELKRFTRG